MRTSRPVLAAAAAATLSLALAACADSTDETAEPADQSPSTEEVDATYDAADATFAREMIPHHRQAVLMSDMAADRTENPQVLELAEEISAGQGPEIATMTALLEAWGENLPGDGMGDGMDMADGMDMGDGMAGMAGMMTPEEMADLEAGRGESFDRMFLQMMVAHHEGAIEMAQTELEAGVNPEALQLAEDISSAQRSEIERMQDLLGTP